MKKIVMIAALAMAVAACGDTDVERNNTFQTNTVAANGVATSNTVSSNTVR